MNGDQPHAGRLRDTGQFGGVQMITVPACPHLEGHRDGNRSADSPDNLVRKGQVFHQGRTAVCLADLLCGAPHVDIDNVSAALFHERGGPVHPGGNRAEKLHDPGRGFISKGDLPL